MPAMIIYPSPELATRIRLEHARQVRDRRPGDPIPTLSGIICAAVAEYLDVMDRVDAGMDEHDIPLDGPGFPNHPNEQPITEEDAEEEAERELEFERAHQADLERQRHREP